MFENKSEEEKKKISIFLQGLIKRSKKNQISIAKTMKFMDDALYDAKRKIAEDADKRDT